MRSTGSSGACWAPSSRPRSRSCRLIRELQPPANSRSRRKERGVYLRRRGDDFVVTKTATPLGPIGSRRHASLAARALALSTPEELDEPPGGRAAAAPAGAARPSGREPPLRGGGAAAGSHRGARARRRAPAPAGAAPRARALPDRSRGRAELAEGVLRLRRRRLRRSLAAPGAEARLEIEAGLAICRSARERCRSHAHSRAGRRPPAHRRLRPPSAARAGRAAARRRADHGLPQRAGGFGRRRDACVRIENGGDRDADAAPADVLRARPRVGRAHRRPPRAPGSRGRTTSTACPGSTSGTQAVAAARARSPANCRRRRPRPSPCSRAPRTSPAPTSTWPQLSRLLHLSAGVVRTTERPYGDLSIPRRRVGGRPLPARAVRRRARGIARFRPASTGTTRSTTRSSRSDRRRAGRRPPSSSPASPGAPAGATASAATGTSTGTPAPCCRSCSPWPTPRGWRRRCSRRFPGRRGRRARRRGRACTSGRWRSSHSADGTPALQAAGQAAAGDGRRGTASSSRWSRRRSAPGTRRAGDAMGARRPGRRGRRANRPGRERSCSRAARSGAWIRHPRPARGACCAPRCSAAMRGIQLPHHVVVHDVDGLEPGVYRWPDLSAPVRAGALRDELYRVCLEQGLARDAAFVVIARGRRRRARRPRVPRGAARRRPGRGPAAPARLRASARAPPA